MSSRRRNSRQSSVSGQRVESRRSSRHSTSSNSSHRQTSSPTKRQFERHERYSSGYGSLSGTGDSDHSLPSSPPPIYSPRSPYEDECFRYDAQENQNLYDTIPEDDETDTGTYIQTEEEVSAVRFPSRSRSWPAPDMLMNMRSDSSRKFTAYINGRAVDYTPLPVLENEEGKSLLIEHAQTRLKLPTKVAQKCVVFNSEYEVAFRHTLKTLIEMRWMIDETKPYRGESLVPCQRRSAWDYDIDRQKNCAEGEEYFKVPRTDKVITCKSCDGNGRGKCSTCGGSGQRTCDRCHGFGTEPMSTNECMQCNGGFETCHDCHGCGIGKCVVCDGKGRVISYQKLKVIWTIENHVYIDPIEDVPSERLARASGRLIHKDVCHGCVKPIAEEQLFHSKIVKISKKQISKIEKMDCAVRKQKQTVDLVLSQRFDCQYKQKVFSFFAIGMDKQIYAPNYPNKRFKFLDFFKAKE